MEKLPVCAALWMLIWSLALFSLMGRDKRLAKTGARRVPEKRLFLLAILGGAVGGVAGMAVFRHKTLHPAFRYGMPAILAIQLVVIWIAVKGI